MLKLSTLCRKFLKPSRAKFQICMIVEKTDRMNIQRRVIQTALDKLGLPSNAQGFAELGGRVALRGRTIYTAWLGNKPLGKAALNTLRGINGELTNGSSEPKKALPGSRHRMTLSESLAKSMARNNLDQLLESIPVRSVPLLSIAHAGELASYEELPKDWQEVVPAPFLDPKAFALTIEGDCMLNDYRPGDIIVVSPSQEPRNAQPAVIRLKSGDVVFRIYTAINRRKAQLSCLNTVYPAITVEEDELQWIYPVQFMVRRIRS